jgi:hypothetical protein
MLHFSLDHHRLGGYHNKITELHRTPPILQVLQTVNKPGDDDVVLKPSGHPNNQPLQNHSCCNIPQNPQLLLMTLKLLVCPHRNQLHHLRTYYTRFRDSFNLHRHRPMIQMLPLEPEIVPFQITHNILNELHCRSRPSFILQTRQISQPMWVDAIYCAPD